jgi:hypothetical protein
MRKSLGLTLLAGASATGCGSDHGYNTPLPDYGDPHAPAIESPTLEDRILQLTTPKVDILWTIDNSGSMGDNQAALVQNFPVFMNYFLNSGLDYHIGVTSTDIDTNYNGSQGKLRKIGGANYIEPETQNPIGVFTAMAGMGTTGSGNEKGTGGTYDCLEVDRDTFNTGFYRDEASLHTIIISDEPDSTPANVIPHDEFVYWYDDLKDTASERTFSGIIDQGTYGREYRDIITRIGGINWDILGTDWEQVLNQLGIQAAGLKREYFLSHLPVADTIKVSVDDATTGANIKFIEGFLDQDGNLIDTTGDGTPDGDWTYDASRNSITFVEYIPTALSTVVINYTVLASQQVAQGEK